MFTKERIKEFEDFLKKCITFRFQKFLPEKSIILLREKEYINESELKDEKDIRKIHSDLIRKMMGDIINITCELEMNISDTEIKKIVYGEDLEQGLIELYSKKIAEEYNIIFDVNPLLKDNLEMAIKLQKILEEKLDDMTFNSNAIEILESAGLQELIEKNDELAIEKYIETKAEAQSLKAGSKEEENHIKEEFKKTGSLKLLEIKGKKTIQYIDEFGENHLVQIPDDFALSEEYKKAFLNTKENENIDAKEFFNEIKFRFGEIALDDELDEKTINADKVDQLEFVKTNEALKDQRENGNVVFNSDADTFVLTSTNEVVETERKDGHIEAQINDNKNDNTSLLSGDDINPTEGKSDISERDLNDEDREEIYDKAENKELTLQELRDLKRALVEEAKQHDDTELADNIVKDVAEEDLKELNNTLREENGPKLSMYSNNNKYPYAAYASSHILFFILSMIISLALLVGAISLTLYK